VGDRKLLLARIVGQPRFFSVYIGVLELQAKMFSINLRSNGRGRRQGPKLTKSSWSRLEGQGELLELILDTMVF